MTSDNLLIVDSLVEIFSFIDESAYSPLRLVCKRWRRAAGLSLRKDNIANLVRSRKFHSAMGMMTAPRELRRGNPLRPNKVLIAACEVPHLGIIRYILRTYGHSIRMGRCFDRLFADVRADANLRAMAEFQRFGKKDPRVTLEFACKRNHLELAQTIDVDVYASLGDMEVAFYCALKNNNVALAKLVCGSKHFTRRTGPQMLNIIEQSVDIALLCAENLTPRAAYAVYDKLTAPKYAAPKYAVIREKLTPVVAKFREADAAIDNILETVKKSIIRGLTTAHPEMFKYARDVRFVWRLGPEDVLKINWDSPWGYSYSTDAQITGLLTTIYVTKIYNMPMVEKDDPCRVQ